MEKYKNRLLNDGFNYLKIAILREAEIRLFNCDVKIAVHEKTICEL